MLNIVGIVGSEAAKFTPASASIAKNLIRRILSKPDVDVICSGHCHLGGIDIWAEEIGQELGLEPLIFPPAEFSWDGGYKPRNLQIANSSDILHCITIRDYHPKYLGKRFQRNGRPFCYHCKTDTHVKSGGCWTLIEAKKLGKEVIWHII